MPDETRQVDELEESAEDLYENAPCGYFSVCPAGVIVKVNQTLLDWLGYERDELLGKKSFSDLLTLPGRVLHDTHYEPLLHMQGFVCEIALDLVTKKGAKLPALLNAKQKKDAAGKLLCTRATVFDATQRRRYERELLLERRRAELAVKAKAEFLATVSHEIRNHMHSLMAIMQLFSLAGRKEPEKFLGMLDQSCNGLFNLVNDLLDYSRIEAGKLALEERTFAIRELMQGVASGLTPRAELKGIALHIEIDERIPQQLVGDPIKIAQVLTNLGGNSIKFTECGSITLSARIKERGPHSVCLRFAVTDTGMGIPCGRLEEIFEEFTQGSRAVTERFGGSGLGLTISRRILELYGSTIQVQSELDKGSTFAFDLRLRAADVLAEGRAVTEGRAVSQALEPLPMRGLKVLVAEDIEVDAAALRRLLDRWGVSFDMVGNGSEAVERVKRSDYDLVLMDLQLPELGGCDAARAIRKLPGREAVRLPIIALSGEAEVHQRDHLQNAGFTDCIGKPFESEALFRSILLYASLQRAFVGDGARLLTS